MNSEALELRDTLPAGPLLMEPGWPWWVWVLGAIATVGLLVIPIWLVFCDKPRKEALLTKQGDNAYQEALAGLASIEQDPDHDPATLASAILRRYLTIISRDPTLFETHEEFLSRHSALEHYPEDLRKHISEAFTQLAGLKYDKDRTAPVEAISRESRKLLDQLHQHAPA